MEQLDMLLQALDPTHQAALRWFHTRIVTSDPPLMPMDNDEHVTTDRKLNDSPCRGYTSSMLMHQCYIALQTSYYHAKHAQPDRGRRSPLDLRPSPKLQQPCQPCFVWAYPHTHHHASTCLRVDPSTYLSPMVGMISPPLLGMAQNDRIGQQASSANQDDAKMKPG